MEKLRQRLPIDQAEARSVNSVNLQQIKERSLSKAPGYFNPMVKIFYDRILKRVILGNEELCVKKRFVSLSAAQATVLREVQKETSGIKKRLTAEDLLILRKIILRKFDLEMIGSILKTLVKKGILESEKITVQDQTVEVFKFK